MGKPKRYGHVMEEALSVSHGISSKVHTDFSKVRHRPGCSAPTDRVDSVNMKVIRIGKEKKQLKTVLFHFAKKT